MSDSFWKPSDEQRRTILLLEALGLIHDLGKLSDTFLKSQEPSSTMQYNHNLLADPRQIDIYQKVMTLSVSGASEGVQEFQKLLNKAGVIPCAFSERSDLTAILKNVQFTDWTDQVYSFAELSPFVAKPGLAAISPLEWQKTLGKEMQPGLLVGCLHGAAHIEKESEPNQYKQPYSDVFRATPFGLEERIGTGTTTAALIALPLADIEQIASVRQEWLEKMKVEMRCGLADNRRPHNEVSLWDWGYTVAAMTKAAAAWIFKNGWPAALDDLPYRNLRINLNRLERYMYCETISDALGIRQVLDKSFEQVRELLEETYALANRFYHDETGDYYLFPDLYSNSEMAALRNKIQAQFPSDLCPQVHLGDRVTAGELDIRSASYNQAVRRLVAEPRTQALQEPPVQADNNLYLFEDEWSEGRPENAETCTVCGIRPLGYPRRGTTPEVERELASWATQEKAEQRNICRVCLDRRGRRAQEWATSDLQNTIWTDEVADDNGRLALFTGKLGLEGWLDGTLLNTIKVTGSTTKIPSPARLYRIVETARDFWRQVITKVTSSVVGQRQFRLAIYPAANSLPDLGEYHAYELSVEGLPLSVVWDKSKDRFLTAENLTYFAHRSGINQDELAGLLQGQTFNILEPSAFQQPGQVLNTVQIERVEQLGGYRPDISLLAEPGVCMILVPADRALDLARAVKGEYERQMGRVRDRLPLYLGLVFCPRRTPIRAVLEAGRSMLNMAGDEQWKDWRLKGKNSPNPGECELLFENGITWRVPILAGDCKTRDEWYPRLYISSRPDDTWEQAKPENVTKLRVPNEYQPWKIWVRPSRFDFEFLDTTGRRFEICYGKDGRRPRRTRPFYLEDMDRLDALWKLMLRMAISQRHQAIRAIETTRETWYGRNDGNQAQSDGVFRQFVADTLAGATWPKDQPWTSIPSEWQEKLTAVGVSGELADLAELHMEILKE